MTRPSGSTGMAITPVGLGSWALGGGNWSFAWGSQDDTDSIAAIHRALDAGVNWIDTAAEYGLGHAEEVVAAALHGMAEDVRPYVFTKCGMVWDDADRMADAARIGRPDSIRRECEDSLRRLRTDHIDLYQMHWPPEDGTPIEDYWGALLELEAEGKVRAVGLSNHDVGQLAAAEHQGHVDSLQPPFSAISRQAAGDVIPSCHDNGTGVIVYSPMHSGLLTGVFTAERAAALPEDDWRRRAPDFTTGLPANLAVAGALAEVADRHGTTTESVAVAWTLGWPGVTGAIVGARRAEQVDDWAGAGDLELSTADFDHIAVAIGRSGPEPARRRP
jgi:aryl-alcohol dehydrogenase-like predicted oxidoreductase